MKWCPKQCRLRFSSQEPMMSGWSSVRQARFAAALHSASGAGDWHWARSGWCRRYRKDWTMKVCYWPSFGMFAPLEHSIVGKARKRPLEINYHNFREKAEKIPACGWRALWWRQACCCRLSEFFWCLWCHWKEAAARLFAESCWANLWPSICFENWLGRELIFICGHYEGGMMSGLRPWWRTNFAGWLCPDRRRIGDYDHDWCTTVRLIPRLLARSPVTRMTAFVWALGYPPVHSSLWLSGHGCSKKCSWAGTTKISASDVSMKV